MRTLLVIFIFITLSFFARSMFASHSDAALAGFPKRPNLAEISESPVPPAPLHPSELPR